MFDDLRARLAERRITLELTEAARRFIAEQGFDPVYGARPLRRFIAHEVETRIGRALLARRRPRRRRRSASTCATASSPSPTRTRRPRATPQGPEYWVLGTGCAPPVRLSSRGGSAAGCRAGRLLRWDPVPPDLAVAPSPQRRGLPTGQRAEPASRHTVGRPVPYFRLRVHASWASPSSGAGAGTHVHWSGRMLTGTLLVGLGFSTSSRELSTTTYWASIMSTRLCRLRCGFGGTLAF